MNPQRDLIRKYAAALKDLTISQVWFGYGSAIFIDLGLLTPTHLRDGRQGHGRGEMTITAEYDWRLESRYSIESGSGDDQEVRESACRNLVGRQVVHVAVSGRLPEFNLALTDGLWFSSFTASQGQPDWAIFENRSLPSRWLHVEGGRVVEAVSAKRAARYGGKPK